MIHLLQIVGVLVPNSIMLGRCNVQEQRIQLFNCCYITWHNMCSLLITVVSFCIWYTQNREFSLRIMGDAGGVNLPLHHKSRSSLLAPAHPGGPGKRAVKRLWWWFHCVLTYYCKTRKRFTLLHKLIYHSAFLLLFKTKLTPRK